MIPIYKPYMPEDILPELNEILYSGQLGYGKYGKEFEASLKNFIGCEYLLTLSSYNMAMLVALTSMDLKSGDEVIASPVSCLASNQPFATQGLKVVWADIHPAMGTLCPKSVESKITKNTKAIFHNHFCGYLGKVDEINALAVKYGIPVIDDAIEAFGSVYKGNLMGNLGTDVTVFSFQTVRLPNTIDGGAIAFKSKALYEKALLVRDYGIDRSNFRLEGGEINPECDVQIAGFGGLMSEINSLIGLRQMPEIDHLIAKQRANAQIWNQSFSSHSEHQSIELVSDSLPNYWVYGILNKDKQRAIVDFKQKGLYATGVHINNNLYSVFKNKESFTGVNDFMKRFVAIPCGWWMENK